MNTTASTETMPEYVARTLAERMYVLVSPKTYASEVSANRFGRKRDVLKRAVRLGTAGKWTVVAEVRPEDVTRIHEDRITVPLAVFDVPTGVYLRVSADDARRVVRETTREVWRSALAETVMVHEAIDGFDAMDGGSLIASAGTLADAIGVAEDVARHRVAS